ncbi:uncharacterized protein LOC109834696 [Asparagus officinalis]|uniref:uncharacterized protein LOC109834696 n=1 Tax=Asparagus officinalis TaxID=4686 RepID=UPI00098DF85C|nr:uncharacterized protein LOC109834696 [Asparagus officinalis]
MDVRYWWVRRSQGSGLLEEKEREEERNERKREMTEERDESEMPLSGPPLLRPLHPLLPLLRRPHPLLTLLLDLTLSSPLLPPSSLHCRSHHHHNRPFIKLNQFRSELGRNQLTHKRNKGLIGRASTLEESPAFDPLTSTQGPDPELVAALKLKLLESFLNFFPAGWHAMCLNYMEKIKSSMYYPSHYFDADQEIHSTKPAGGNYTTRSVKVKGVIQCFSVNPESNHLGTDKGVEEASAVS